MKDLLGMLKSLDSILEKKENINLIKIVTSDLQL